MSDLSSYSVVYEVSDAIVYCVKSIAPRTKEKICEGTLRVIQKTEGVRVLAVGNDLTNIMFTYLLPGCFCIMSGDVINCPASAIGYFMSILLRGHGVGDMDEFGAYLTEHSCVVREPRYESGTETWAWRVRKAGEGVGRLVAGAGMVASRGIAFVGSSTRNFIEPAGEQDEHDQVRVPDGVHKGLQVARDATAMAASVATTVVSGVGRIVASAASTVFEEDPDVVDPNAEKTDAQKAVIIGKSAIAATLNVWGTMMDAEAELVNKTAEETAKTIAHSYGDDAGSAAREGMHIVGNVVDTGNQLRGKAVIKSMGKGVAQGTVGKNSLHGRMTADVDASLRTIDFGPVSVREGAERSTSVPLVESVPSVAAAGGAAAAPQITPCAAPIGKRSSLEEEEDDILVLNVAHAAA